MSKDGGRTWGEQKMVCAIPDGERRPGMAIVTRLLQPAPTQCAPVLLQISCGIGNLETE